MTISRPQKGVIHIYTPTKIYCGANIPPPYKASDTVVVTFKTDRFLNRRGFSLVYHTDSKF